MADAYASETRLAAWLHVQRADVLERRVGRFDAALGALERALQLDPGLGPVRSRLTRHAAAHGDWSRLARLLEDEAAIEPSETRAARLELDAAVFLDKRLGDPVHGGGELLENRLRGAVPRRRAWTAASSTSSFASTSMGEPAGRRRTVPAGAPFATSPTPRPSRTSCDGSSARRPSARGDPRRRRRRRPARARRRWNRRDARRTRSTACSRPRRSYDQRIAAWLTEAARTEDPARRARVFARAAGICEELGRAEDALKHFRSAWIANPGDPDVLDALARLLAPQRTEIIDTRARALVEVYGQAAEVARDPGRKVAYLERVALLWEEILGDPTRAARAYTDVLAIDPDRRSAVFGLERTASRGGDGRTLARAARRGARLADDKERLRSA